MSAFLTVVPWQLLRNFAASRPSLLCDLDHGVSALLADETALISLDLPRSLTIHSVA